MPRFEIQNSLESTVFLSQEDVDFFHEDILESGQCRGYKQESDLLGAIGRPKTAAHYEEQTDLVRIAAYYWHGISTSHGYVDGNKRTGFVCAVNFLLMNGVEFDAPDQHLGPLVEQLFIDNVFSVEVLEDILRRHCVWA